MLQDLRVSNGFLNRVLVVVVAVTTMMGCKTNRESDQGGSGTSNGAAQPVASSKEKILDATEPFARELKALKRAIDLGIEQPDYNARLVRLAELFDALQEELDSEEKSHGVLVWAQATLEVYQSAAKHWTYARTAQEKSLIRLGTARRDLAIRHGQENADESFAQRDRLKETK